MASRLRNGCSTGSPVHCPGLRRAHVFSSPPLGGVATPPGGEEETKGKGRSTCSPPASDVPPGRQDRGPGPRDEALDSERRHRGDSRRWPVRPLPGRRPHVPPQPPVRQGGASSPEQTRPAGGQRRRQCERRQQPATLASGARSARPRPFCGRQLAAAIGPPSTGQAPPCAAPR